MGIANLTPQGFETLIAKNELKKAHKKIPWASPPYKEGGPDQEGEQTLFKVYFRTNDISTKDEANASVEWKNRAAGKFIEHYFPEYYPLMRDDPPLSEDQKAEIEPYRQQYEDLRQRIQDSLVVDGDIETHPGDIKNKVVYATDINFFQERTALENPVTTMQNDVVQTTPDLPNFELALETLNSELARGESTAMVSVKFQNVPTEMNELTESFSTFGAFLNQLQQRASLPNLNSMQSSVNTIIKKITDSIHDSIDYRTATDQRGFHDTDYFTVSFDQRTRIVGITYFVAGAGTGPAELSKVGYITNIKYNPIFKDPFALNLLKNYKEILESSAETVSTGDHSNMLDFFARLGAEGGFNDRALAVDPVYGLFQDGPFAPRNVDDYVAVDETGEALTKALAENPIDPERLAKLQELAKDPVFKRKMLQAQTAKTINTTVQVLDVIGAVGDMDFFSFANNTKEGREVNRVLQAFGIQDLAQEVLTCLTLGLGASVSRITGAVKDAILENSVSFNSPPSPPSAQINLERPDFSLMQVGPGGYFSITGDPPIGKRIVNMLLDQVTQAGFEIIKGFTEMLKFNCGDVLDDMLGVIDCGAELSKRNAQAQVAFPDLANELAQIAGNYELTLPNAYQYLSDVSRILTPIELCRLLNSPEAVISDTIENILDFNEEYDTPLSDSLNTESGIISFFQSMSAYIDTVSFCNEVIDSSIAAAIEGCEICLSTDLYDEPLGILADIAENGFQMPLPDPPNLLCQDADNYLTNPIAEITLPRLYNNIAGSIQTFMAGSLEGARTRLLEPILTSRVNTVFAGACEAAGVGPEPVEVDPTALAFLTDLFDFIQDLSTQITDAPELCGDITDIKFNQLVQNMGVIVAAVNAVLEDAPEIIEDVTEKINSVSRNLSESASAGQVPHIEYVFPEQFKTEFENAIEYVSFTDFGQASYGGQIYGHGGKFYSDTQYFGYTSYTYSSMQVKFGQNNSAEIFYNAFYDEETFEGVQVGWQMPATDIPKLDAKEAPNYVLPEHAAPPHGDVGQEINLNPYIFRFTDALIPGRPVGSYEYYLRVGEEYPALYASTIRGVYDYIVDNGAFSADVINNLQLFKDNKNCTPANVGDLFDADGIIDQMKKEFAAAACYDNATSKEKVQGAIYFGLINMLIQTIIDEFVVTNICVFTALNMTDILSPRYPFKEVFINYVVDSFQKVIADGNSIIERELFNYFNRVALRPTTHEAGGFTHSYSPTEVAPGFESPNFPLNNPDLIKFLVEERLGYTWIDDDGTTQRSTIQAIQNVLDPGGNNKLFENFFIEDVIGIYDLHAEGAMAHLNQIFPLRPSMYEYAFEVGDVGPLAAVATSGLAFLVNADRTEVSLVAAQIHPLLEFDPHVDENGYPTFMNVQILFSLPISPTSTSNEIVNLIKNSDKYQLFFSQTINKDACLLIPIFHNFYLTARYFSDVGTSFNSTKQAIIYVFNVTQESQSLPALEPRQNEFVTSLAKTDGPDLESMARDIFLKFLKETPINILKGLVELIDPHVSISKIIRDFSGAALTKVSQGINGQIHSAPEGTPLAQMKADGITGEDVMGTIFCIYNIANQVPSAMASPPGQDNLLFGPKLTLNGVDFTGTVAGMLMLPPSPLGFIYLLLELLKVQIEDDLGAQEEEIESGTESEDIDCPEGTTPLDIQET